jgi:uncharacterized protein YeaO (DUF488 family)
VQSLRNAGMALRSSLPVFSGRERKCFMARSDKFKSNPEQISVKRVYEPPHPDDGSRVLVDRLWPRGLSKADAGLDLWLKEIAPSNDLRKWFAHDADKWAEFQRRYFVELDTHPETVRLLRDIAGQGRLTLLYGARDEHHNQAVALKAYLTTGKPFA